MPAILALLHFGQFSVSASIVEATHPMLLRSRKASRSDINQTIVFHVGKGRGIIQRKPVNGGTRQSNFLRTRRSNSGSIGVVVAAIG